MVGSDRPASRTIGESANASTVVAFTDPHGRRLRAHGPNRARRRCGRELGAQREISIYRGLPHRRDRQRPSGVRRVRGDSGLASAAANSGLDCAPRDRRSARTAPRSTWRLSGDDAIARFKRNTTTGAALRTTDCLTGETAERFWRFRRLHGDRQRDLERRRFGPRMTRSRSASAPTASRSTRHQSSTTPSRGFKPQHDQRSARLPGAASAVSSRRSASMNDPDGDLEWQRAPASSGLNGLTVSPDGTRLYATADGDSSIARFSRNTASGALTFKSCINRRHSEPYRRLRRDSGRDLGRRPTPASTSRTRSPVSADGKSIYLVVQQRRLGRAGPTKAERRPAHLHGLSVGPDPERAGGSGACDPIPTRGLRWWRHRGSTARGR